MAVTALPMICSHANYRSRIRALSITPPSMAVRSVVAVRKIVSPSGMGGEILDAFPAAVQITAASGGKTVAMEDAGQRR